MLYSSSLNFIPRALKNATLHFVCVLKNLQYSILKSIFFYIKTISSWDNVSVYTLPLRDIWEVQQKTSLSFLTASCYVHWMHMCVCVCEAGSRSYRAANQRQTEQWQWQQWEGRVCGHFISVTGCLHSLFPRRDKDCLYVSSLRSYLVAFLSA